MCFHRLLSSRLALACACGYQRWVPVSQYRARVALPGQGCRGLLQTLMATRTPQGDIDAQKAIQDRTGALFFMVVNQVGAPSRLNPVANHSHTSVISLVLKRPHVGIISATMGVPHYDPIGLSLRRPPYHMSRFLLILPSCKLASVAW